MSVHVRIPTPLRPLAAGKDEVEASGATLREVLDDLEARHGGLKARVCDDKGEVRRFVNLYLNEEDIRELNGLESAVKDGDVISIIPAIAGGGA
ncbi:MoaD/ThiS family protein [bacterium]|nr:MoaD/ThiS family protein [bacterium]MCB9477076.1 MoaD/ThiS family protein [Deltaproteobacteria bacterium]